MQMKNTNKKSTLLSGFCLIMLTVLIGVGAAHAQTVTYKCAIKMPPRIINVEYLTVNDSGLGATDLDTQEFQAYGTPWKSRFLMTTLASRDVCAPVFTFSPYVNRI